MAPNATAGDIKGSDVWIASWHALIGHRRSRILAYNLEQGEPKDGEIKSLFFLCQTPQPFIWKTIWWVSHILKPLHIELDCI